MSQPLARRVKLLTSVIVVPESLAGDNPIRVTYDAVTRSGHTWLTTSTTPPPTPGGFQVGDPSTFYYLSTDTSFTHV